MSQAAKILLVEDDPSLGFVIKDNLSIKGYDVTLCRDGEEGHTVFGQNPFHLCILDVMLPKKDGFALARNIREKNKEVPILFLTAKAMMEDKLEGFRTGADDYITKPFSPRELVSRIKAVLRRTEGASGSMHGLLEIDKRLKIDFDRREIWLEGKLVKLRPTEYRLLFHLVQNAGWVVSHDQLLQKVWGYEYRDEPHYVRLYINYLRQKLEKDPADPQYILTERGVGYRFVDYKRSKE
jgi:two-component system alkaline phosphatase synthesis response regulator PhoP